MLKLLKGRSYSGIEKTVLLRVCAEEGGPQRFLIVPEHASYEAERALCAMGGDSVSLRAEVLTFRRLATRVFGEAGGLADERLSAGGRILAMKRSLDDCRDLLTVYAGASGRTEIISGLVSLTDELKESGVTAEMLADASKNVEGSLAGKLADLSLIAASYGEKTENGVLDPSDANARLAERLPESTFMDGADVYFCGFSGFTAQEYACITQILRKARSVTAALVSDDGDGEEFYKERRTEERIRRAALSADADIYTEKITDEGMCVPEELHYLEKNMFSYGAPVYNRSAAAIRLHAAESVYSECEAAAAEILRLVRENGARFRDITVLLRKPDEYAETIESVFERFGIASFISVPTDLLQRSLFAFALSAIEFADTLSADALARALAAGCMDVTEGETDALMSYARLWSINGRRWLEPFRMNPDGYTSRRTEDGDERLAELDRIRIKVTEPFLLLREAMESCTGGGEYARALWDFLVSVGVPDRMTARTEELFEKGEYRKSAEYAQLWNILTDALSQFSASVSEDKMTASEFTELLSMLLAAGDVDTIPVSLDRVTVSGMERLGFSRKKYALVLGAADGSLPLAVRQDSLLTDDDRAVLSDIGMELPRSADELALCESGVIYRALTHATDGLYISYPKRKGGSVRPSYIMERLAEMFPCASRTDEAKMGNVSGMTARTPLMELACLGAGGAQGKAGEVYRAFEKDAELSAVTRAYKSRTGRNREPVGDTELTRALYGKEMRLSPSRVETYAQCPFSHFMRYGLRVREEREQPFDAPEIGTFIHYVLERVLGDGSEPLWETADSQTRDRKISASVRKAVREYVEDVLGGLEDKSARFIYLFGRLSRSAAVIVRSVVNELSASDFKPLDFEIDFSHGDIPPYTIETADGTVRVTGKADRVDGYVRDGRLYIRVVDYKTGIKSFRLSDIKYGLNMQMLVYLFALERRAITHYRKKLGEIDTVSPAGILYIPAREPFVSMLSRQADEEELRRQTDKMLRRSGLVLDEPEIINAMERGIKGEARFIPVRMDKDGLPTAQSSVCSLADFGRLAKRIETILTDIAAEMRAGRIDALPACSGADESACRFCRFAAACLYDETRAGDVPRYTAPEPAGKFLQELREGGDE